MSADSVTTLCVYTEPMQTTTLDTNLDDSVQRKPYTLTIQGQLDITRTTACSLCCLSFDIQKQKI